MEGRKEWIQHQGMDRTFTGGMGIELGIKE
jgi:hypothetical protein